MITAEYRIGKNNFNDIYKVRDLVFVKEQRIEENLVFDSLDNDATHVIVYDNKSPVATGRMIFLNNQYVLGRIAVLKSKRGNHYGDLVVKMLLDKAFNSNAKYVYLHSQVKAIDFYKKIGFLEYGDFYLEAGIEHVNMRIKKEDINRGCVSCG